MKKIEIVLRRTERNTVSETILVTLENLDSQLIKQFDSEVIVFPGLTISLSERTVYRNGEAIDLTKKEFRTLVFLLLPNKNIGNLVMLKESGDFIRRML